MVLRSPGGALWLRPQPWSAIDLVAFDRSGARGFVLRQTSVKEPSTEAHVSIETFCVDSGGVAPAGGIDYQPVTISGDMIVRMVKSVEPADFARRFPSQESARRSVRGALFVPQSLPFAMDVVASGEGTLFVQRTMTEWLRFDVKSQSAVRVQVPADVRIEDSRAARIIGLRSTATGTHQIVELSLEGWSSGTEQRTQSATMEC